MTRRRWSKSLLSGVLSLACTLGASTANAQIRFQDVSDNANIKFSGESYGASWGDINGDGYPDIFANNHRQMPSLYVNNGNGRFTNIATSVTEWKQHPKRDTHGGAFADFDNDGDQDLFVATGFNQPMQLLVNENGTLNNRAIEYGIEGLNWGANMISWADLNNDGLLDFFVGIHDGTAGVFQRTGTTFGRRNGGWGVDCFSSRLGMMSDLNLDGRQELMCSVFGTPLRIYDTGKRPFTDKSHILANENQGNDAIWADFDGDLRPDLLHVKGKFQLSGATLHGDNMAEAYIAGKGSVNTFELSSAQGSEVTVYIDWKRLGFMWNVLRFGANGKGPGSTGSRTYTFTLDSDNPAHQGIVSNITESDHALFVGYDTSKKKWIFTFAGGSAFNTVHLRVTSNRSITGIARSGMGGSGDFFTPRLYINKRHPSNPIGDPSFTAGGSTATSRGLDDGIQAVGAVAADFDNDMDLDIYFATRGGARNTENVLYRNNGNGYFTRVSNAAGGEGPVGANIMSGAGSAGMVTAGDYDVDGFVDLFLTNGIQLVPREEGGPSVLLRNTSRFNGNNNHWMLIDLQGTNSNRDGIGATVHITTPDNKIQLREQNGGYHRTAQDHMRIHVGLGSNTKADVSIRWPSGRVDTHQNIKADRLYTAVEGGSMTPRTLGGGSPPPHLRRRTRTRITTALPTPKKQHWARIPITRTPMAVVSAMARK